MAKQPKDKKKYRLITRSDFDGIVSAALLMQLDMVEDVLFTHPKEVQEGRIEVTAEDIVANLPYVESAFMAFDHKMEIPEKMKLNKHHALFTDARSVSEVIFEYYGAEATFTDGVRMQRLVELANKSKSALFSKDEVLSPQGWEQLIFMTDPRTGLGRFKEFRISNYALMQALPKHLLEKEIDEILVLEDVAERVILCEKYYEDFKAQLKRCTHIEGDVAVIDLRHEEIIYPGNRYMVYALFPEISASIHLFNGHDGQKSVFALGKSIFNDRNGKNIYQIVRQFGGGGHADAGTCQVAHEKSMSVLKILLHELQHQEMLCETN